MKRLILLAAILAIATTAYPQARVFNNATATVTATGNGTTAGAATLNNQSGQVTTEALTTAGAASYALTLTNDRVVGANALVFATVTTTGAGTPVISKVTPAAGSVVITVANPGAVAFTAACKIYFCVLAGG